MAHFQQLSFIREVSQALPEYFSTRRVLEVGSWDANGSIRSLFQGCDYLGVDLAVGPGVDRVCKGEEIREPDQSFDVVISCECFEHNQAWVATLQNMIRMLKPGGLCVVTCATLGRPEHGTKRTSPGDSLTALNDLSDYYRNLAPRDIRERFDLAGLFEEHAFYLNPFSRDLYFVGIKKGGPPGRRLALDERFARRVRAIQREKATNPLQHLKYAARFWFWYALAFVVGERTFHDLRHRPR